MSNIDLPFKTCKNCGNTFSENFCNRCGQKEPHRITIPHVFHDLIHVFLHADKGIFPFTWRLIKQPGLMAREYLEGKRKIFNPFQFLILSVGVAVLLMAQTNIYESIDIYTNQRTGRSPELEKGLQDLNLFVRKYSNIITFLSLPVYALFSWLNFKKRQENYAEHFTLLVFSISQINILTSIVLIPLIFLQISWFSFLWLSILLTIICFSITYKQFYTLTWYKSLWKAIVVYILSYLVQFVIMLAVLLMYVFMMKK